MYTQQTFTYSLMHSTLFATSVLPVTPKSDVQRTKKMEIEKKGCKSFVVYGTKISAYIHITGIFGRRSIRWEKFGRYWCLYSSIDTNFVVVTVLHDFGKLVFGAAFTNL